MLKIITYSDLHLEFEHGWTFPGDVAGDILILAGDIITFANPAPLANLLKIWANRPVLYVAGNHEFYTRTPMDKESHKFKEWLALNFPHVHFLQDEAITINGVHFFGGTMWTDFQNQNPIAMEYARRNMNDFRFIFREEGQGFTPQDGTELHKHYVDKLIEWFEVDLQGPRVVISHHAPVINPVSRYGDSPLQPAFNSLDMVDIIERYQPNLWVYGHTHECDNQVIGRTKIISNQLGYRNGLGGYECLEFDKCGKLSNF